MNMKAETRELHNKALELLDDEDAHTWMDADPSVAWDDPESLHGRLGSLLEDAGWERCWHRHGALFHYNVKIRGNGQYRGFYDTIADYDSEAASELKNYANDLHDSEMEFWWEEVSEIARVISESMDTPDVYSCGRSGGYLNIPQWNRSYHVPDMIALSDHLRDSVENYDSYEYGQWLAQEAIDRRAEDKMQELASDRIERIEA